MNATSPSFLRAGRIALALLVLPALAAVPAQAGQFALFKGQLVGVWKTTAAIGVGYRAHDPDLQLVGAGAGQTGEHPGATGAVSVNDDAQLNFPNMGDRYAAPLTLVSELSLVHPKTAQGIFVRVRGWHDMFLEGENVPHGHGANSFTHDSRLVDDGFLDSAKFSGADFYDAYYFGNFKLGESRFLTRIGRQVIDWGEGIFFPGINTVNPYDYAWLTMVGAPVLNGGKLPVNRVYANLSFPQGWSIDGYYNLEWRSPVYAGCGTYGSALDISGHPGCNAPVAAGSPDQNFAGTPQYYLGEVVKVGFFEGSTLTDTRPMSDEPDSQSGWGLSAHTFLESIKTEVGLYYATNTANAFVNSAVVGATNSPAEWALNTIYPDDVETWALSASSGVRNVALSGQVTRILNYPAHYNAPAYVSGSLNGIGPHAFMYDECKGRECQTYSAVDITELQGGGTWQFGEKVGLPDATLSFEADFQRVTNLPPVDGPGARRLGRYGNYGEAAWTNDQGYVCNPGPLSTGQINYCEIDGFVTDFTWGYKVRLATSFPKGPSLTFFPALTFSHDVAGYAADQFTHHEGRMSLSAFLRTQLYQNYYIDASALWYKEDVEWDPMQDRGQYTLAFGINF